MTLSNNSINSRPSSSKSCSRLNSNNNEFNLQFTKLIKKRVNAGRTLIEILVEVKQNLNMNYGLVLGKLEIDSICRFVRYLQISRNTPRSRVTDTVSNGTSSILTDDENKNATSLDKENTEMKETKLTNKISSNDADNADIEVIEIDDDDDTKIKSEPSQIESGLPSFPTSPATISYLEPLIELGEPEMILGDAVYQDQHLFMIKWKNSLEYELSR